MELYSADIVWTREGIKVEVVVGNPPWVVLFQAIHDHAVGAKVWDVCESIVASVFVHVDDLEVTKAIIQ